MTQKYFRMEIRSLGPRLVRKQDVDKEGRLELTVNIFETCVKLWRRVKKLMLLKRITDLSSKSGGAFRVGFGPKVDKNFGLNSGLRRAFCLECTKI